MRRGKTENEKVVVEKGNTKAMWARYAVELNIPGKFGASLPRTREEILEMLKNRMPKTPPADAIPIEELTEIIADGVGVDNEEEKIPGWATFLKDKQGFLCYEGRCVRGHMKDGAHQVVGFFPELKNFRAKFVNRVYVEETLIPIFPAKRSADGTEHRFIQVMTRMGPRSAEKYIDFVEDVTLKFHLRVLNDGVIEEEHLLAVFEYGGTHGIGQERGQDWGRYEFNLKQVEAVPRKVA